MERSAEWEVISEQWVGRDRRARPFADSGGGAEEMSGEHPAAVGMQGLVVKLQL
jgi:hypothetical protein